MLKKMRKKAQDKKGFTLVELIVVIVIILILAAVLVPSMLKYVEKANKANCKADAATILSQLQADYASALADNIISTDEIDANVTGTSFTIEGIEVKVGEASTIAASKTVAAVYTAQDDEITEFAYSNGKYVATWTASASTTGEGGVTTSTKAGWTVKKVGETATP